MNYTQQRDEETVEVRRFRNAMVLKPVTFDLSVLKRKCQRIVYATDGYGERTDELRSQLEVSLQEFDPHVDVLIPLGSGSICVMAAAIITRNILVSKREDMDGFMMGVYLPPSSTYEFWHVPIHAEDKARELVD